MEMAFSIQVQGWTRPEFRACKGRLAIPHPRVTGQGPDFAVSATLITSSIGF